MLPWAIRQAKGWWRTRAEKNLIERANEEIRSVARAFPAAHAMQIKLDVAPNTRNGFHRKGEEGGVIDFRIVCTSLAPFGIRPSSFQGYASVQGNPVQCKESVRLKREIVSDFLKTGEKKTMEFDETIEWSGNHGPVKNECLYLAASGKLTILGPWDVEYGEVDFSDSICVKVTE